MTAPDKIERAARLLADARPGHRTIADFPQELRPADLEEAYRIQERVGQRVGRRIGGWKVGLTSAAARRRYAVDRSILGCIFEHEMHPTPAHLPGKPAMLCLEAELAFRIGRTLPPRATPYSRAEVVDAIDAMLPALEICCFHYVQTVGLDVASVVADNSGNAGLVLGAPVAGWQELELADQKVRVVVDGQEICAGSGAEVMEGDPLLSVVELANHLSRRGFALEAGQVVSTGTMHGAPRVSPTAHCLADFGPLGRIVLQFKG